MNQIKASVSPSQDTIPTIQNTVPIEPQVSLDTKINTVDTVVMAVEPILTQVNDTAVKSISKPKQAPNQRWWETIDLSALSTPSQPLRMLVNYSLLPSDN